MSQASWKGEFTEAKEEESAAAEVQEELLSSTPSNGPSSCGEW